MVNKKKKKREKRQNRGGKRVKREKQKGTKEEKKRKIKTKKGGGKSHKSKESLGWGGRSPPGSVLQLYGVAKGVCAAGGAVGLRDPQRGAFCRAAASAGR